MSEPKITILLPSRGRTTILESSIQSLVDHADDPGSIQFILGFDNDDTESSQYFVEVIAPQLEKIGSKYLVLGFDPIGYENLHKYLNMMAKHGQAPWWVFWNDDAVMLDDHWDTTIASQGDRFCIQAFDTHNLHPYSIFPIVPRKWYELLGYISPHPTQDGWVSQQAYMLDIYLRIPVNVLHDRFDLTGNNNDDIFNNRPMLEGKPQDPNDFHSVQMIDLRHQDCAKLAMHMRKIGASTEFFENIFKGTQDPWQRLAENDINSQMVQFDNPHRHFKSA